MITVLKHNETTLARAAAAYGPIRTEHDFIRAAGCCTAAIGTLTDALLRLQDGLPVCEAEVTIALSQLFAAIPPLWVSAEVVGAMIGQPSNPEATTFFSGREAALDQMERDLKKMADKRGQPRMYPPGTMLYNKNEILDLVCTMAAREAAEKEGTQK